jgi:hypothetical protein
MAQWGHIYMGHFEGQNGQKMAKKFFLPKTLKIIQNHQKTLFTCKTHGFWNVSPTHLVYLIAPV